MTDSCASQHSLQLFHYSIGPACDQELPALANIWERAVRATHTFLTEEAILDIRHDIYDIYLPSLDVYVARDGKDKAVGFIAMRGTHIAMLFIDPPCHRQGLGKKLVAHVLPLGAQTVDVNEQNPEARKFYHALGFTVKGRSDHDAQGNPFPILHLHLSPPTTEAP